MTGATTAKPMPETSYLFGKWPVPGHLPDDQGRILQVENMADMTDFEAQLATLICEVLNLEDVSPADFNPEQPLFDGGLGLDSIDALEIAVAIAQEYNVHLKAEDEKTRAIFSTLRNLANHITQETGAPSA